VYSDFIRNLFQCVFGDDVISFVKVLIRQKLCPQQVVRYLVRHKGISLHHETVYQLIYTDKAQGGDLYTVIMRLTGKQAELLAEAAVAEMKYLKYRVSQHKILAVIA
jgi:IS30 family transposase